MDSIHLKLGANFVGRGKSAYKVYSPVVVFAMGVCARLLADGAALTDAKPTEPMVCMPSWGQLVTPPASSPSSLQTPPASGGRLASEPAIQNIRQLQERLEVPASTHVLAENKTLKLPAVSYEPPPYVDGKVPWEWIEGELAKSESFAGARVLSVEAGTAGGMAQTHKVVLEQDGKKRVVMVKVFNRHRPFFSAANEDPLRDRVAALMLQRQIGLQRYLSERLEGHRAAGDPLNVEIVRAAEDKRLLGRGILVQDFVAGQTGQAWEGEHAGKGYSDFWKFVHEESPGLETVLGEHYGLASPASPGEGPLGIDVGRRWDNFIWTGEARDIRTVHFIDW